MPQQQIIQLKQPDGSVAQQIIQLKPNNEQVQTGMQQQIIQGPNGIFQVFQPLQAASADGQDTLFIPSQQHIQQAFITPTGQIIRGPLMGMTAPGSFLQNIPQTVQLPNGKIKKCYSICIQLWWS